MKKRFPKRIQVAEQAKKKGVVHPQKKLCRNQRAPRAISLTDCAEINLARAQTTMLDRCNYKDGLKKMEENLRDNSRLILITLDKSLGHLD